MLVLLALSTTFLNATVKSGVLRHGHDRLCGSGTMAASVGRFQSCAVCGSCGSSQYYADTRKRLGWLGCKAYPIILLNVILCMANCRVMGYEHKAQPCPTPSNTCLFPIDEVLVHFQWWCLPASCMLCFWWTDWILTSREPLRNPWNTVLWKN